MKTDYEYIVIGLGALGSAAAYWLSKKAGGEVLGLEQFEIGHVRGGSQDHSRIIRLSYHTPNYVTLAKLAYDAWEKVEADDGAPLIVKTGGLDLSPPNAVIDINDYRNGLDAHNIPYEFLDAKEAMYRWPQWQLTDDISVLYQAESGIAPAANCMAAHLRLAQKHGATLRDNAPVTRITPIGDELEVEAGGTVYRCRQLVIAAGAWSNQHLAHFNQKVHLTVTKEQVTYFDAPDKAAFAPDRFPVWIWMDEPSFYGMPSYGEPGPKAAQDAGGKSVSADTRTFDPDPDITERVNKFASTYLPSMGLAEIYTKTCLYTMPPDRDFILSKLPEHPNVQLAIGAGHAFKFSSAIGRILSELAVADHTDYDLSAFGMDRPILYEENPELSFMV